MVRAASGELERAAQHYVGDTSVYLTFSINVQTSESRRLSLNRSIRNKEKETYLPSVYSYSVLIELNGI